MRCILSTLWSRQIQGVWCFWIPMSMSKLPEATPSPRGCLLYSMSKTWHSQGRVSLRLKEKAKRWSRGNSTRCYVKERSEKWGHIGSKAQAGSGQNEDHGQCGYLRMTLVIMEAPCKSGSCTLKWWCRTILKRYFHKCWASHFLEWGPSSSLGHCKSRSFKK